jgi:hypothetical protein
MPTANNDGMRDLRANRTVRGVHRDRSPLLRRVSKTVGSMHSMRAGQTGARRHAR